MLAHGPSAIVLSRPNCGEPMPSADAVAGCLAGGGEAIAAKAFDAVFSSMAVEMMQPSGVPRHGARE